jgi:hypothetical protein
VLESTVTATASPLPKDTSRRAPEPRIRLKEKNSALFILAWPFSRRYASYSMLITRYFPK